MKATATTTQTPYGTTLVINVPGNGKKPTKIELNFQPSQSDLLFSVQKAFLENQTGVTIPDK